MTVTYRVNTTYRLGFHGPHWEGSVTVEAAHRREARKMALAKAKMLYPGALVTGLAFTLTEEA